MPQLQKILIIDDETHVRKYLSMLVTDIVAEVEVLEASDGPEGIEIYSAHQPDIVLLDINMIGSSGLDTLTELRSKHPDAKVVMVTSVNVRRSVEQALESGAEGYILKDAAFESVADDLKKIFERLFGPTETV